MTIPPLLARLLIRTGLLPLFPGVQRRLAGGADYLRYYSDRLLVSPLQLLERLGNCVASDTPDVLDLASGTPRPESFPAPRSRPVPALESWPDPRGLPELRGAIATKLLQDNRLAFSPTEEILVTQGALGAVQILLDAFVNRGDKVLLLDPISPLYSLLLHTRGARLRWVSTRLDDGRLRLRFDQLSRGLRGAKLLILNSPANPTGGILSAEDLEQIAWWASRYDVLLLSDEVFERFSYSGTPTSLATFPLARSRTLTVGSVSKSHGLTSLRVGWIAASRHLLLPCALTAGLRAPFVAGLPQHQALLALQNDSDAFHSTRQMLHSRRDYVHDRLQAMGFAPEWPSGGFFFWLRVPAGWETGRAFAEALYSQQRVRVLPGDLFGPSGKRRIRLSYVIEDGRLEEGLNRISELVRRERQPALWRRRAA